MKDVLLITVSLLVSGCGSTADIPETRNLRDYEATFRPSDFDQPPEELFPRGTHPAGKDSSASPVLPVQPPELTQGYRVQIFASSSYDQAMQTKSAAEAEFTDEWFYIVYDAPTYKVRAGNFIERYEAEKFARQLAEKGYKDSWVVPERVYSSPPPRPSSPPEVQNPPK